LFSANIYAEPKEAITTDGKTVLLKSDGTWVYKKEKEASSDFDFRKTRWGMSKSKVKATESGKIVRDNNILGYEGNIAGLDTLIVYIFVKDKLVRAKYIFIERHSNMNDYLSDYSKIKEILSKKYKSPTKDKTYWKKDLYKNDYQNWGMAVAVGHLAKYSNWKTTESDIWLSLSGDNYKISHIAEYLSIRLANLEKAKSEQEASDQF
jgi:hypothetical protein